jgi:hypothetical protein
MVGDAGQLPRRAAQQPLKPADVAGVRLLLLVVGDADHSGHPTANRVSSRSPHDQGGQNPVPRTRGGRGWDSNRRPRPLQARRPRAVIGDPAFTARPRSLHASGHWHPGSRTAERPPAQATRMWSARRHGARDPPRAAGAKLGSLSVNPGPGLSGRQTALHPSLYRQST